MKAQSLGSVARNTDSVWAAGPISFMTLDELATSPGLRIPWTEETGRLQSMGLQESDMT